MIEIGNDDQLPGFSQAVERAINLLAYNVPFREVCMTLATDMTRETAFFAACAARCELAMSEEEEK